MHNKENLVFTSHQTIFFSLWATLHQSSPDSPQFLKYPKMEKLTRRYNDLFLEESSIYNCKVIYRSLSLPPPPLSLSLNLYVCGYI